MRSLVHAEKKNFELMKNSKIIFPENYASKEALIRRRQMTILINKLKKNTQIIKQRNSEESKIKMAKVKKQRA